MSPSAGGQYQWVSEFAPPSMQKVLSYISGWLAALGWQAFIASSAYQTGSVILILASMQNPAYVPTVWWVRTRDGLIWLSSCFIVRW
jgi:choline transport protein